MSFIISLSGNSSDLESRFFPPIELDGLYECALLNLITYNSISNVKKDVNDKFYIGNQMITLQPGAYEITDFNEQIQEALIEKGLSENANDANLYAVQIRANNNTLKTEITTTQKIYFDKEGTIRSLLGFESGVLEARRKHISEHPIKISSMNSIRVECDLIKDSFQNGKSSRTIFEFFPPVPPGYLIQLNPRNLIYLKVNTQELTSVRVSLVDSEELPIDLRGEHLIVRLHLRKINADY